eukprot:1348131-Rhodomonas_salina.7
MLVSHLPPTPLPVPYSPVRPRYTAHKLTLHTSLHCTQAYTAYTRGQLPHRQSPSLSFPPPSPPSPSFRVFLLAACSRFARGASPVCGGAGRWSCGQGRAGRGGARRLRPTHTATSTLGTTDDTPD